MVRAGDIVVSHDVEIINPEHVIAHLSSGGKLALELKVEKNRGYLPGNLRQLADAGKSIGCSFSMPHSAPFAVSATLLKALASNSAPILTS